MSRPIRFVRWAAWLLFLKATSKRRRDTTDKSWGILIEEKHQGLTSARRHGDEKKNEYESFGFRKRNCHVGGGKKNTPLSGGAYWVLKRVTLNMET